MKCGMKYEVKLKIEGGGGINSKDLCAPVAHVKNPFENFKVFFQIGHSPAKL